MVKTWLVAKKIMVTGPACTSGQLFLLSAVSRVRGYNGDSDFTRRAASIERQVTYFIWEENGKKVPMSSGPLPCVTHSNMHVFTPATVCSGHPRSRWGWDGLSAALGEAIPETNQISMPPKPRGSAVQFPDFRYRKTKLLFEASLDHK